MKFNWIKKINSKKSIIAKDNCRFLKEIIFLDFDGVMTSVKNGTSFLCCNTNSYHIDGEIKSRFETLFIVFPNLKVVLSTAWCNRGSLDDPTPNWPWKGIDMPTPLPELYKWLESHNVFYGTVSTEKNDEHGDHITKHDKIKKWLIEHEDIIDKKARIVVLDDDASDYNNLRAINRLKLKRGKIKFFQTNYEVGFSKEDFKEVFKFLSKN